MKEAEDERLNLYFYSAKSNSILRQSCENTMKTSIWLKMLFMIWLTNY